MTGTVELDREGAHLLIRFPYREDLVAEVKNVPGRRWDSRQKTWRVPTAQVELVYATFSRHLFEFAPEVSSLLAGTLGGAPRAPAVTVPVAATATADAISVSTLNERVRGILRGGFEGSFWLVGEIVDLDKQGGRQHRFFSLVEKAPGEARPRARVEAALFEGTARTLLPRLAAGGTEFTLRDGIEIRALVHVDLYVPTGRFQVVVDDIDPTFTLGKLALSREAVLLELQKLQLAERNRSLPLPTPARRIGVLASPDSDGWNDFLRQLQESGIGFDLTLVPVRVQGAELRPSMLAALAWLAERAADFDAVCILRGGGSRTDLAGFDDRDVALAVARHPLKILIGIGHQRDLSVLDAIAHSEKTPTAVAAFLVRCALEAVGVGRPAAGRRPLDIEPRRPCAAARGRGPAPCRAVVRAAGIPRPRPRRRAAAARRAPATEPVRRRARVRDCAPVRTPAGAPRRAGGAPTAARSASGAAPRLRAGARRPRPRARERGAGPARTAADAGAARR
jgi:exodeoxyribonuclease VII large subunit